MAARCGFCSATLDEAPPGAAVRCASCGNLTMTPSLPATRPMPVPAPVPAAPTGLPFADVSAPKQAAAPPPSVVLPSRAGGVDELVGGGLTLLGIGVVKLALIAFFGLGGACLVAALGYLLHC